MVDWINIDGKVREISPAAIKATDVLDSITDNKSFLTTVEVENLKVDISVKHLFQPLGDLWRVLFNEGDYKALRDSISTYWKYRGTPVINADILKTDQEAHPIRIAISATERQKKNYVSVNRLITDVNDSVNYDRVYLGSDDHDLEFQFLSKRTEKMVRVGDMIQSGIFVHVNGGVRVSPGVHRLVCTNGMVQQMTMWKGSNYRFGDSMINESIGLANWMIKQADHKIENFREISVAFKVLPEGLLKKYSKEWAEKIDLKDLTWYDVINDLTASVNDTLSSRRYKVMSVSHQLMNFEKTHRCQTCSAHVGSQN